MTLHWWQHWFWITAATPAILLVLTTLESACASSPWEEPTLWSTTAWFPAAASPGSWSVPRRLLGFAIPQPGIPVAGLPSMAPAPVNPGVQLGMASSTPTAVITPTVEAVIYTLSPSVADFQQPSVQSVPVPAPADAQNKSSQSVNTASQKTPPAKATRPKTLKTTALATPKSSMIASKLPPKTITSTTSTTTTTSATPTPTTTPTTVQPPDSVQDTTSPGEKGPSEQSIEQVMNDSPADVPAASVASAASAGPATTGTLGESVKSSSVASPPASAANVVAPFASTTTLAPVEEAPVRAESTSNLEIVHPGVSFDNASGLHRSSSDSHSGLDAGSITGIALGVLLFAVLVGSVSFVLYRRRYLNKPQTLNDKCSNPDSSGYIDDSTLRENSEEMYSLDNDSFLNSLEAMTIQNYWTDSVKHTKL